MPDSKILILGSSGQVGRALLKLLGPRGIGMSRSEADLSRPDSIARVLGASGAVVVINVAAYTQVDQAEGERDLAFRVNAEAPGVIARFCAERGILFVHFSTDYVFNGEGTRPWTEEDRPAPLNVYGQSKLEGEKRVLEAGGRALIFRTSWVYDSTGKNFFTTMLRVGRERDDLRVVADQIGAPTFAPHLAEAVLNGLESASGQKEFPTGIYHLCHAGETSWHGFAQEILGPSKKIEAIRTGEYPARARRPLNSRLDTSKAHRVLGIALPDWKIGLEACKKELK